jgi:hypothetical protein
MTATSGRGFLIHDRDTKFSRAFDAIFHGEAMRVIRTPVRAPNANAHIERWVGTIQRECPDRLLIVSRGQLERVLRVYIGHYNKQRPHRTLDLQAPTRARCPRREASPPDQPRRSADKTCPADSSTKTKRPQQENELIHPTPQ